MRPWTWPSGRTSSPTVPVGVNSGPLRARLGDEPNAGVETDGKSAALRGNRCVGTWPAARPPGGGYLGTSEFSTSRTRETENDAPWSWGSRRDRRKDRIEV